MNKFLLFTFSISMCLLLSCTSKPLGEDNATLVILNLDTVSECSLQSRLFDNFQFISLENKRECLITEIDKLADTDEGFYILDRSSVPVVLHFSHDGTFKNQIGRIGHGKNEYTYIDDMTVNDRGDTIAILNYNKILFYDNDGVFLEEVKLDDKYGWDMLMHTPEGYLMGSYHRGYDGVLTLYDSKFSKKKHLGHSNPELIKGATSVRNLLQKNSNYISYFDPFASVFYIFNSSTKELFKKIALKSSNMVTEETAVMGESMSELMDQLVEYLIVDDLLYCMILHKGYLKQYEIDFLHNEIKEMNSDVGYHFECEHEGFLYKAMSPHAMKSVMSIVPTKESASLSKMKRVASDLARDFSDKDNYYIMRMTYK